MDSLSSNIYKKNLDILSTLDENNTIYYEENIICIEDRLLGRYRYGNNPDKIKEIIKFSFLHYYNHLLMKLYKNKDYKIKYDLLNNSLKGITKLVNNNNILENEKKNYESLRNDLLELLSNIEPQKKEIDSEIEKDNTGDKVNNCFKNLFDKKTNDNNNYIFNSLIIIKNKLRNLVLYFGNLIFN
tara:strand:+ start:99 stop:653 length:555 start_codon:yes stop_codon:yes gene_type:complete